MNVRRIATGIVFTAAAAASVATSPPEGWKLVATAPEQTLDLGPEMPRKRIDIRVTATPAAFEKGELASRTITVSARVRAQAEAELMLSTNGDPAAAAENPGRRTVTVTGEGANRESYLSSSVPWDETGCTAAGRCEIVVPFYFHLVRGGPVAGRFTVQAAIDGPYTETQIPADARLDVQVANVP